MKRPSKIRTTAHSTRTIESELIERSLTGEGAAFEAIMRRHNQLLFRTARSIVRSDSEAEDLVQEAYLKAWRALASYRGESRLSTWLVRIVTNEALGRLRRSSAQIIPLEAATMSSNRETQAALTADPAQSPERIAQRAQLRRLMEARIDRLPEQFRSVFMLRAIEELSVTEVSEMLEIPEATVRSRFFRARGLLREGLAQEMDLALGDAFSFDGARCDRIVAGVLEKIRAAGL